jgi:hypothetical protein
MQGCFSTGALSYAGSAVTLRTRFQCAWLRGSPHPLPAGQDRLDVRSESGNLCPPCGCSSMVERLLPKQDTRVRFSSPAPQPRPRTNVRGRGTSSPGPGPESDAGIEQRRNEAKRPGSKGRSVSQAQPIGSPLMGSGSRLPAFPVRDESPGPRLAAGGRSWPGPAAAPPALAVMALDRKCAEAPPYPSCPSCPPRAPRISAASLGSPIAGIRAVRQGQIPPSAADCRGGPPLSAGRSRGCARPHPCAGLGPDAVPAPRGWPGRARSRYRRDR